jgi:hypothetical protein
MGWRMTILILKRQKFFVILVYNVVAASTVTDDTSAVAVVATDAVGVAAANPKRLKVIPLFDWG